MITILAGAFITVMSIAGLAVIIEGATGAWSWFSAWMHACPRPPALPHAKAGTDDEENQCN